ncbi:MAG: T9SS type A sorting domain-containing protein [Saprospiraceae bacterium]|nr:T9SS type A sorting domain-containing protein [Saprospiraceae bacterium]
MFCTATDASGYTTSCTFNVTVEKMPYDSMQPPANLSPEGHFDRVRDRFGNPYRLSEIQIPETMNGNLLCVNSGYFNLYFEPGCGMEGNTQDEQDRRDVLCQLFSDLSAFIVPANPATKVNIWIRDIAQIITSPATSGYLGLATSYYVMPAGAPNIGGLVDGQVWKTINSGVDAYTGVTSPLANIGGAGAGFYHGFMAFNFSNPNITWHDLPLSAAPGFTFFDLYSVALHEATHALGFASLINFTGQSGLAPQFAKYYTRYDSYLRNASSSSFPLIVNSGPCSLYDYQFNYQQVNTSELQPGQGGGGCNFNNTICATAIKFAGSVNQKVFTPNCFKSGSSLSHLEDVCRVPVAQPNDQYYVMSNANDRGPNFTKRYLKPEERQVLCDLGYKINSVYAPGQPYSHNYNVSACNPITVAGVNDGIGSNGTYTYMTNINTPITISNALANDHQALSMECVQIVFGGGSLSGITGSSFTYTATTSGVKLLRYVPANGAIKGNITYIYILIKSPGCAPDICNMVSNGGFEQGTNCGLLSPVGGAMIDCWSSLSYSPDLFSRNCNIPGLQLGVSTYGSIPPIDSHNGTPNDKIIGLFKSLGERVSPAEAVQTQLQVPLINGQQYTLSFWAKTHNNINGSSSNIPALLQFASTVNYPLAHLPTYPVNTFPVFFPDVTVPNDHAWHFFSQTFTFNSATPHSNLLIAYSPVNFPAGVTQAYVFLDDVKLIQTGTPLTFAPPTPLCVNAPIEDLSTTVSIPGGTFSGPGVNGNFFNPANAGVGTHTITYTYTDPNGCVQMISAVIQVALGPNVNFAPPSLVPICLNATPIALNAIPSGGTFSGPGVFCNGPACSFYPGAAGVGTHTLTYTYTGGACPVSKTTTVQVITCVDVCEVTNNCLAFDGINDYVTVPNPLISPTQQNNFTVACWFRDDRQQAPPDNFLYRLFGLGWNGPRFEVGDQDNFLTFFSLQTGIVQSNVNIRDGQWHHVAAVKNGNFVTIYLDCAPVTGMVNLNAGNFNGTAQNFHIGDWAGGASNPRFWQGRIDEFKLWDGVLSAPQLCDERFCSLDPNNVNLLVHFPLDQFVTSSTLADNVVASGLDGTLTNFNYNGATSDWVDRGRDLQPVCNPNAFVWIEGNNRRNISGRSKVYDSDIFTAGQEYITTPPPQPISINYPVFSRRSPDGSIKWRTILPVQGVISDFIRTDEGCYLLVGYTPNFANGNRSFIARIDHTGALDWLHEHEFGGRESLSRIIRSDNPDNPSFPYVVCGIARSLNATGPGSTYNDVLLFTIDNQGTIDWFSELGDLAGFPTNDFFNADLINYQGGYALTGTYLNNFGVQQPVVYYTDNAGFQLATSRQYQSGLSFLDIEPAAIGNGMIIGAQTSGGDAVLAKVDANGAQVWARQFPNMTNIRKLVVMTNGDIFALGQRDATSGQYHNAIIKVRDLGNNVSVLWQKHAELTTITTPPNTENNWTPADLIWYSGKMFFFTDSRVNNSVGFGSEDIGATLNELDLSPDNCPFTRELTVNAQNFTLVPAQMPALGNVSVTPGPPTINTNWTPLVLANNDPCMLNCQCEFVNLQFSKTGLSFPNWLKPVSGCGLAPVALPGCPGEIVPIRFSGRLKCKGGCGFSGLSWAVTGPNGGPVTSGASNTANFSISLTLGMLQIPGTYTITLNGQCGGVACTCVVQFTVPQCPPPCTCTQPGFSNAVNGGFQWVQLPNCKFQLTPRYLGSGDNVTWTVTQTGGSTTTIAGTVGNALVNYTFPNSGQYIVCMTVQRIDPLGNICQATRCQTLNVDCSLLAHSPGDLGSRDNPCDESVVQNGGFTEGAEAGGLAEEGLLEQWDYSAGNPEISLEAGKLDTNLVRLRGNGGFADLLFQDSLSLIAHDSLSFSIALRPNPALVLPGTELVVRLSAQRQDNVPCDEINCIELMRLPIPELEMPVWLTAGSFVNLGAEVLPYLTVHVENPFFDDDVALQSVIDIDNICLSGTEIIISTEQPDVTARNIRLYPNPNTGQFTLDWQGAPWPEGRVEIAGPLGQALRSFAVPEGASQMEVQIADLPAGMYFVKMLSAGRLVKVMKVVKR